MSEFGAEALYGNMEVLIVTVAGLKNGRRKYIKIN